MSNTEVIWKRSRARGLRIDPKWFAFTNGWRFNSANSFRVKHRCQMVVKLKANKCYLRLLCYLFSYINFFNITLCGPLKAFGRFQTFSPWFRTHNGFRPHLTLALIIIILVFVYLIDWLIRRLIAFNFTELSVLLICLPGHLLFDCFWSFDFSQSIIFWWIQRNPTTLRWFALALLAKSWSGSQALHWI